MYRVCNISKEQLSNYLKEKKTTRQIAKLHNVSSNAVSYWVRKYNLTSYYDKPKLPPMHIQKIDTKELAYTIGFIIADAHINQDKVEIGIAQNDMALAEFFSKILGTECRTDDTVCLKTRRHPRVRVKRKIHGLSALMGGSLKADRIVPRIGKVLEPYMLRGIFDADGCITWGFRKDRGRIWHKVSFTSSYNILISVQNILYKIGISTVVRPKGTDKCYVLEFSNRGDVLKFYDYLYANKSFVPLKRKFDKYNALRLELGEFGETAKIRTIPSRATDLLVEGVETTGGLNGALNNQIRTQAYSCR